MATGETAASVLEDLLLFCSYVRCTNYCYYNTEPPPTELHYTLHSTYGVHNVYGAREVKEGRRTAQTYVFRRLKNPSSQHQMKDQLTNSLIPCPQKRDKIEPLLYVKYLGLI